MRATLHLAVAGIRRRGKGQTVVLLLVTALASAAVVAGLASTRSTGELVDAAYERAGRPDVVLYGTEEGLRAAAEDDEIVAASPPVRYAEVWTVVGDQRVDVQAIEVDRSAPDAVGAPELVAGRWPEAPGEVVVERSLVTEGVVGVGETFTVGTPDGERELAVVGAAIELSDCFWPTCDPLRVFGDTDLIVSLEDGPEPFIARYRLAHPDLAPSVGSRLLRDAAPGTVYGQNTWPDTRGDILVVDEVFGAMVAGFGVFMLVAACVVVAGATAARLVARRRDFGLLRAVGFRPRQLTAAVLAEHALLGAAGVVLGWIGGSLFAPQLSRVDAVLDASPSTFELLPLAVALVLIEALLALAIVVPAWRAGRQPATEVLRDVPPAPTGGRVAARLARAVGARPSTVAGLRRTLARPWRATLAAAAVLVAAVGSVVATGFIGGVQGAVDDPARTGNPFDIYAFPTTATEEELAAALDADEGVAGWHTEREATAILDDASYLTRLLGGDPDAAGFRVQEGREVRAAGEAMVGYGFLQDTGLDVGDSIVLDLDGTDVPVTIVGWYLDVADTGRVVMIREETVAGTEAAGREATFRIDLADGADPEEVAARVQAALDGRAVVLAPDFGDGGFGAAMGVLGGFAVLLGLVAAANLLATTLAATRERARALGVLRTVGCTTRQLVAQSAIGTGVLGFVAGVVGAPLGFVVFDLLADAMTSGIGVGPGLAPPPPASLVLVVVPVATVVAAVAGGLAAVGLSRRPAAELVRYE